MRRQGANRGATTAFLISTPESGVDSIAVTYALIDPVMTVARPVSALAAATAAGLVENLWDRTPAKALPAPDLSCPVDNCCDGLDCPPEVHRRHHRLVDKIKAGLSFAVRDLWADLAGWFFVGLILAGLIVVLVPTELLTKVLGGGLSSMLIMLVVGLPLYICATASTPIAAALILKGVSPGAALVFLLVGPATNVTSLTMVTGLLGKRATAVYLVTLSIMAVLCGLALDQVYALLGAASAPGAAATVGRYVAQWSPFAWPVSSIQAVAAEVVGGIQSEVFPGWLQLAAAGALLALSLPPLGRHLWALVPGRRARAAAGCACTAHSNAPQPRGDDLFPMAGPVNLKK
jgi:uncharacterized membrane protein YraQ (UPF0718 family)